MYGSLTLKEEHKLMVYENWLLRRRFGPEMGEVTGEYRRLHNEKLYDLHCSPNIIRMIKSRRMKWAGHVVSMGDRRGAYKVLVGRTEGMRPLGRRRRR